MSLHIQRTNFNRICHQMKLNLGILLQNTNCFMNTLQVSLHRYQFHSYLIMATESVLVTGASGYIGSHCIVTLLEGIWLSLVS